MVLEGVLVCDHALIAVQERARLLHHVLTQLRGRTEPGCLVGGDSATIKHATRIASMKIVMYAHHRHTQRHVNPHSSESVCTRNTLHTHHTLSRARTHAHTHTHTHNTLAEVFEIFAASWITCLRS